VSLIPRVTLRTKVLGNWANHLVGSEGFYGFCDALTAGGADSKIGLVKM